MEGNGFLFPSLSVTGGHRFNEAINLWKGMGVARTGASVTYPEASMRPFLYVREWWWHLGAIYRTWVEGLQ